MHTAEASMRLTAYPTASHPAVLRPGSTRRRWMDDSPHRFAYRCLPLTMANQCGWELLCPCTFEAVWNGLGATDAITVIRLDDNGGAPAESHFGQGVLTFHSGYLFRTS